MLPVKKTWLKPYIYLLPVLSILFFVFTLGLGISIFQSLGYYPGIGLYDITLDYYREVFSSESFFSALMFSLRVALISSLLAAVIGVSLAYLLVMQQKERRGLQALLKLPIIVPHLVAAFLIFTLFSQSGMLARLGVLMGFIEESREFPGLIFDSRGVGVILAYVWKGAPFIFLIVYQVLRSIETDMVEAASNLGAKGGDLFFRIFLPLSLPSVFSTFIILFAFSFGSYEIPFLLGPTSPRALPVLAYVEHINPDWTNRPYAMAMNMVLAGISVILVWLYHWVFKRYRHYRKRR
ncbi:ABC transporter permease [Isachenkonia alkalipeptolytica]|uniref:ABC transporter permease subunit n=1 Tax=Isachenkonia alkalipeptolytica TaxID=2565777 RepID=A0AA43XJ84_9CLOT|nr:ABC transporter permease subunit [Isachenkonia alkalipeptolytica]NBG87833.1 ABC transporter permease subunit [Isachenkonia alkalipeptolytica]